MRTTEQQRRKGRRRPVRRKAVGTFQDRIAQAYDREREHARVGPPESETVWAQAFRCVCCGKLRGGRDRREPRSEVCAWCVAEAGFWN